MNAQMQMIFIYQILNLIATQLFKKNNILYMNLEIFKSFNQIIIWRCNELNGTSDILIKLYKKFQDYNLNVNIFSTDDFSKQFNYINCLFISDEFDETKIPIILSSTYCIFNIIDSNKYLQKNIRLLQFNFYENINKLDNNHIYLDKDTLYSKDIDGFEKVYLKISNDFEKYLNQMSKGLMMCKHQATIISALYDINRQNIDGRSVSNYIEWLKNTCKSVTDPMIIYLDKNIPIKNILLENRNGPTYFIETDLNEVPMWKYRDQIDKVLKGDFKTKMKHPKDITNLIPEYCIIQYSKFGWLENAININKFNTDVYIWMDSGLSRFYDYSKIRNLNIPKNFKYFAIESTNTNNNLLNLSEDNYIGTNQCYLRGGMWVIHKSIFNKIKTDVLNIFENEMLNKNKLDNEQIALALTYKNNISNFLLIPSSNKNIISIYNHFFN
jgi:hypothetical protein